FPFFLFLSQAETEATLHNALEARGLVVERETALLSFDARDDGITAVLDRGGRTSSVRARYLVGCDGAHSTVRHLAGLSFEGAPYRQEFFLADVDVETELPTDRLHFFMTTRGLLAMFPFFEPGFVRLLGSRARTPSTDDDAPSRDAMQVIVDELCTAPIR